MIIVGGVFRSVLAQVLLWLKLGRVGRRRLWIVVHMCSTMISVNGSKYERQKSTNNRIVARTKP